MKEETSNETFAESVLGPSFFEDSLLKMFQAIPAPWRVFSTIAGLGALLFIPYLGAVGLWDPWETHYGEVARQMVARNDFVYPYWENAWFFSKPALTLWMDALGMKLVGANNPTHLSTSSSSGIYVTLLWLGLFVAFGAAAWVLRRQKRHNAALAFAVLSVGSIVLLGLRLANIHLLHGADEVKQAQGAMGLYTEWGMRLPFACLSILAVSLLSMAVGRVVNRRAGLATGFVLLTMPMYFLLSRQVVTDTPFVATLVCAMACAIIGQLDQNTKHRTGWWYGFYVFAGMSMLAKGLLGLGLPAVILLVYACFSVIPWTQESWAKHFEWIRKYALVPLAAWVGVGAVVAAIAYWVMSHRANVDGQYWVIVHGVIAGLAGFCAGLGAFLFLLHRAVPREGEMPVLWAQFYKMRLGTGVLVFFALQTWYVTLSLFTGVDDESKLYAYRFFVHDHFARLAEGVHTTTPGGDFIYFIEQGGFAIFPWVLLVPGALALTSRLRLRSKDKADHVGVIAAIWVALTFFLFSASETKFHHYVFPVLPGLAVMIGLYIDKLWKEGIAKHAMILIFGLGLFMLVGRDLASHPKDFTDLFVYNYDRAYPTDLVTKPVTLFGTRSLWWGDIASVLLLAFGGYLTFDAFMDKARPLFSRALGLVMLLTGVAMLFSVWFHGRVPPSLSIGIGLCLAAGYTLFEAARQKDESTMLWLLGGVLAMIGLAMVGGAVHIQLPSSQDPALAAANDAHLQKPTHNWLLNQLSKIVARLARIVTFTPPSQDGLMAHLTQTVNIQQGMGFVFGLTGVLLVIAAILRSKTMVFSTGLALALGFALWFNWNHWVDLSHHWTQRDLFWKYYRDRKPDEPITAFLMNWRGETFYSRNQVKQIKDNPRMTQYAALPGRKWALVEHNRLPILRAAAGPSHTVTVQSTPETNNKFVLVTIE